MKSLNVELITPYDRRGPWEAVSVHVPAEEGPMTVLSGHHPMVCSLTGGEVRVVGDDGEIRAMNVGPGSMTVTRSTVSLIVQDVEA